MTNKTKTVLMLRSMVVSLLFFYAASLYAEWTQHIAPEAAQYQNDYPDTVRSGFALGFAVSKLFWFIGSVTGVLGSLSILFGRTRKGMVALFLSAPLVAVAAYLNAPQSDYPSVEPIITLLLWCATSAMWASVATLAWVNQLAEVNSGNAEDKPNNAIQSTCENARA
jgi:hypothetical protein